MFLLDTKFIDISDNFWLIITIILIAYIGISKIGSFCIFKNKKECTYNKQGEKCEKLMQKDHTYLLVIVTIIIVILISLSLYTDQQAMNLFSFASTITSIILSVIAIIMTITSETKNASTKEKLEESAKQIQMTTELLEEAVQNIDPEILQKIEKETNTLQETMEETIEIIKSILENSEKTSKAVEETKEELKKKVFVSGDSSLTRIIPEKYEKDSQFFKNLKEKYKDIDKGKGEN